MIGRAAIDCGPWGWSGRTVRVEVWQKDDDGTWQPLHTSITDWLGMDQPDVDQQIDGAGFWCKNLNGGHHAQGPDPSLRWRRNRSGDGRRERDAGTRPELSG